MYHASKLLLQSSIENNFVSTIYFWYVHNLNEQNNPQIKEELTAMQTSARALLKTLFPKNEVEIFAVEVGNETIEKWYNAASKQIAVTDTLDVETPKVGFELTGDKWRADHKKHGLYCGSKTIFKVKRVHVKHHKN